MSSAALAFDRLAYVDRLKSGGVDEEQARAHAAALETALRDGVATKPDIDDLRRELQNVEVRLQAKIETSVAGLKVDILRWLVVTQIALAAVLLAVLRFGH